MPLLEIKNLTVRFPTATGLFTAVDGVDVSVDVGEVLAIVGESGSGKSVTMMALMGLIDAPGIVQADCMQFDGTDMLRLKGRQRRHIVGKDLAMVFQDPMAGRVQSRGHPRAGRDPALARLERRQEADQRHRGRGKPPRLAARRAGCADRGSAAGWGRNLHRHGRG